ncbi:type II secretion system F family protein [Sneathiella sp. HT1-7]|jgi:tight adherence protein C|uniref:type II secretion system F family protein n=1 Tax=Sneathiella sp. HT1-7 TaxID=2887192 RepID=UPI001D149710|nr:type II secretion system F family protein [Sneathiella sp. HT1-7]MCC3305779.1 type II secretion system F family protein [Sneathiella sp. HT1-7]
MSVFWQASMDDMLSLMAIGLCVSLALAFFIIALRARKSEHLDKRLRLFVGDDGINRRRLAPPVRIDLEREEATTGKAATWLRPFSFGKTGKTKQNFSWRFIRAGIDPVRGKRLFLLARIFLFIASSLIAAFLQNSVIFPTLNTLTVVVFVIFSGVASSFLPFFVLNYQIKQRQRRIERAMPDMIDLLILCVEAGLTLEVALARAIEGLEPFAPDVAAEMKITLSELKILPDKSMALTNLEERTASKSLKYLVLSLRQSERYGTSITGALKSVAVENRKHAILDLENSAARMPALLSIPLILFILPPVVALSAGPGFALMMRAIGG